MTCFQSLETICAKAQQWATARLLCLFLLVLGLSGCTVLKNGKPPGAWYDAYEPISDVESTTFVSNALELAVAEFGKPVVPVNKVILRRTTKSESAHGYAVREDFSLTECVDSTNGVFVIYVGVDQDHENYYALLGHECAHLLNPYITDWYMEGIATVFSEQVCAALGKEWGTWKRHFMKSRREPYALSYRMMLDMKESFPEEYPDMQRFYLPNGYGGEWQMINIDGWLSILPEEQRNKGVEIIEPHVKVLERQVNQMYSFQIPEELKDN